MFLRIPRPFNLHLWFLTSVIAQYVSGTDKRLQTCRFTIVIHNNTTIITTTIIMPNYIDMHYCTLILHTFAHISFSAPCDFLSHLLIAIKLEKIQSCGSQFIYNFYIYNMILDKYILLTVPDGHFYHSFCGAG